MDYEPASQEQGQNRHLEDVQNRQFPPPPLPAINRHQKIIMETTKEVKIKNLFFIIIVLLVIIIFWRCRRLLVGNPEIISKLRIRRGTKLEKKQVYKKNQVHEITVYLELEPGSK